MSAALPNVGPANAAVVVPFYRGTLTADEQISARHLVHFLSRLPIIVIAPPDLARPPWAQEVRRFDAEYFRSVAGYSRLLLSPQLYRAFDDFEYVLIYQLDALVFSSDLGTWCARGHDYIGAPWLHDPARPEKGFARVGNGGLSLRRVAAHLEVLGAGTPPVARLLRMLLAGSIATEPTLPTQRLGQLRHSLRVVRELRLGSRWYASHYSLNEDRFWSDRAHLFSPAFQVAPQSEGLAFSFEQAPELAFSLNGDRLPFGCHGWARYGREFWAPHLLR